jgi:hypothetical protein
MDRPALLSDPKQRIRRWGMVCAGWASGIEGTVA